ncbi:choice-of-anchor L domain-containing protein [Octadecabacter sp. 1_MG-2023]|uniref:choice-of-anchor L domain-containing protein n=1 Tax=unclassified Octadecabacter TaxID=196158 RepID=UPI001C08DBB1|nr:MULTISPECIES: choice-of-anchor L domain-containing protein [unclassified Octadecabacter]MBU2991588.1 calcium-binding protein [Octadecabacter sp. B2R22]MDO6736222.1 choice-of-anchor L domain-containing protein [Octadecabacter sp. 1_MG-2023]
MSFLDQLRPILGTLEDDAIVETLSNIPIIADDLTSLISSLNLDALETAVDDAIAVVDGALDPAARAAAIAAALDNLDGITASATGTVVSVGLTAATNANVNILDGGIGLGGSAFSLDARADFDGAIDVTLDLNLTYDTATDTLALVDTPEDELVLNANISADVSAVATMAKGFIAASLTDTLDTPEIQFSAGFDLSGLTPADLTVTYGGSAVLQLDLETMVADDLLPGVMASLEIAWDPLDPSNAPTIMFSDVGMKIGDLLDAVVDMLDPVTDILFEGIIGDIVGILTDPLPIINDGLNAVGLIGLFDAIPTSGDGIFNLLDGLGIYFRETGNTQAVTVLSSFAEALGILKQLSDFADNDGVIPLGSIMIPGFDPDIDLPDLPEFAVADIGGLTPIEFLSELADTTELFAQVLNAVPGLSDAGIASLTTATIEDDSGLSFPLFENPELILNVLLPELTGGGPVSLIEYDIPAITAEARFGEYFFRIFGPFGLTIDGFAEATIDFTIGYDTFALQNPGSSFVDGLFITTEEMMPGEQIERQPEDLQFEYRPIAYSSAGIFAGVAVDAVVLRVGVKGGIVGFVAAFLPGGEVDTDAGEIPNGVLRLSDFGSGCFLDPILGRIGAEVIASIKVGFGFFSFEYDVTIADITIANFDFGCPPALDEIDGLARYIDDDTVALHVGPEAGFRVIGGQVGTDIGETYRISEAVDDDGLPVTGALRIEYEGFYQNFGVDDGEAAPTQINANFQDADDALVISADLNVVVAALGGAGNDILEGAALNDDLRGQGDNDRLFGRGGDDTLYGGAGNDYLEGGLGADILNGGADRDRVSYENSAVGVTLVWNGAQIIGSGGEAEGDVLTSIEYLVGSSYSDILTANPLENSTLQGNGGDDVLRGGIGDDFLLGDAGSDFLFGNLGHDGTSYVTSFGGVQIDLASGAADGGDATGDVLVSIESVMGSAFADVLEGTTGFNQIAGWVGDDIIDGRGGADEITTDVGDDIVYARGDGAALIDGGDGRDLLSYVRSATAVSVDLGAGTGNGSGSDTIGFVQVEQDDGTFIDGLRSTFEDLDGSNENDTLIGDLQSNTIQGLNGDDTIFGADGNDILRGGFGNDVLDGGNGADWADYTDGFGVTVFLSAGAGFGSTAQGDTLTNIENVRGSDGRDSLFGDDQANIFAPLLSTDQDDYVDGGDNDDTLQLDYSREDWGLGIVGGLSAGRIERQTFDGLSLLDGVTFTNIENFQIVGTFKEDSIETGAGNDRLYLGGGDDVVDSGSGADIVLTQEGDDTVRYFSEAETPLFHLDGGLGDDGLSIRLANAEQDITIRAGFDERVNMTLSSGASVLNFENLDLVRTGNGADLIEQGGISDNDLHGGGNADVINPGRGIDIVNGGSEIVTTAERFEISDRPLYIITTGQQLLEVVLGEVDQLVLDWSDVDAAIISTVERSLSALAIIDQGGDSVNNNNSRLGFYTNNGVYQTADTNDQTTFRDIESVDITGGDFNDDIFGTWEGLELIASFGDSPDIRVTLQSARGNDTLRGGLGEDTLTGLTGSDTLFGGADDDTLIGTDPTLAPSDAGDIRFDAYEIDTMTGGDGADQFILGTLRAGFPFSTEHVFYTGSIGDDDETDSRAIITDFDADEGDRLVLAGRADDYTVEVTGDGVNILLAQDTRNIIAHLEGLDDFVLDSSTSEFRTAFFVSPFPITPVFPLLPIFSTGVLTPTSGVPNIDGAFSTLGASAVAPSVLVNNFAAANPSLFVLTAAPTPELTLTAVPDLSTQGSLISSDTSGLADLGFDADTKWVNQANLPSQLSDSLFEGVSGEITGGTLTLEGDGRAFGIFDGDPFGLGQGIVLSTGIAEDLDGTNEIDGGLFGPYAPELPFEDIGRYNTSSIFRADLSFVGTVLNSITIADDGDGLGGGLGVFSGLELDALILSRQLVTAEDLANGIDLNDPTQFERLDVFDYASAFSQFTPGSIRSGGGITPVDTQGTENGIIDLSIARLGEFDYGGTNDGSFTMGDGGVVGFDLTTSVDTDGPLYLYVAEGGATEELTASITASDSRLAAPADLSTDFGAEGSDGDLTRLTYDFEMNADAGKVLTFDFAFVTEELREFAGTEFNDALRIFLNGEQLAVLSDGTALTVNQLLPAPFAASHPDLLFNTVADGAIRDETRADAYTTPLTFAGRTQAGENTLVIEVEDTRDGLMDSAVLIRAGSLNVEDDDGFIGIPPDGGDDTPDRPNISISSRDVTVTEGEGAVSIDVSLTGIIALTSDVTLTITPGSIDVDFGSGAGNAHDIVFTAGGSLTESIDVSAPIDGLVEPTEFVLGTFSVSGGGVFDGLPVAPILIEVLDASEPETTPFSISLGDAPDRFSRSNPNAWRDAWTDDDITIDQSADVDADIWAAINLGTRDPGTFGGSSLHAGDLGVSGRSGPISEDRPQEIDGAEGLRFGLADGLTGTGFSGQFEGFDALISGVGSDAARVSLYLEDALVDTFDFSAADGRDFSADDTVLYDALVITSGSLNPAGTVFIAGALDTGLDPIEGASSQFRLEDITITGFEHDTL